MNTFRRFILRIPCALYDRMLEHAVAELPNECCGLLAGRMTEGAGAADVERHYPLVNEMHSPTDFRSEPKGMFAAVKQMRQRGLEILAVYHSHPTSSPVPSRRDLEWNSYPNAMSLIIGLVGGTPVMRGWWLGEAAFEDGRFEVV